MNTYKIIISKPTSKGKRNLLHEFVVNSENEKHEVQTYYLSQYGGFGVEIEEVKEIALVEIKKEGEKSENEYSLVRHIESSYTEFGEDEHYKASIHKSSIEGWDELIQPIFDAQKTLKECERAFELKIVKIFGLKNIQNFSRTFDNVYFKFQPSQFKFKKPE